MTEQLNGLDSSQPVIAVHELRKVFHGAGGMFKSSKVVAVDGVSVHVERGETVAVVGESGCGKSTLARLVLGLEHPTSGEVRFRGMELSRMGRAGRRTFHAGVQAVFQDPYSSLSPRMKVKDIVAEPLQIQGKLSRAAIARRVTELLEHVGLDGMDGDRYPHQFSGGQRQRIAIARALSVSPALIVLDEPVSALDVSVRAQTLNLLNDLQDEFGMSYLFISHDLAVVAQVARRVVVMYLGQILEEGTVEDVFSAPKHPYTRALLRAAPQPRRKSLEAAAAAIKGEVASADAMPSGCRFHPRCPMATAICSTAEPILAPAGATSVRCLIYERCRPASASGPTADWPQEISLAGEKQESRIFS